MSKSTLLKAGLEFIYQSGAARLLAPYWGGRGVIFCLHHVKPSGGLQSGFAPNNNLETTPEFLDEIITLVQSMGYDLVSMSEVAKRLTSSHLFTNRFVAFTLDDGYKDNLVHAMPIFKQHNCPFTVYVAPRIADGTCELWWRGLEAVITKAHSVSIDQKSLPTATTDEKWNAWKQFAPQLQTMPEYEQRSCISRLAEQHHVDLNAICREAAMTWDELRLMASDPLLTIGAHTMNHYNLLKLSDADARREIQESGQRISAELKTRIEHFAYPYGNKDAAGGREFEFAKAAGYRTAVVTRLGTLQSAHANYLHALPRVMVSGRYQKKRYIETLISGVPSRLANGFAALNVS